MFRQLPTVREDTGNSDKADQPENADTAEEAGNTADDLLKDAPVTEAPSAADAILPDETEADNALTAASGEETKEDTSAKITKQLKKTAHRIRPKNLQLPRSGRGYRPE